MAELRAVLKTHGVADDDPAVLLSKFILDQALKIDELPAKIQAAAETETARIRAAAELITKSIEKQIRSANASISQQIATAAATAAGEATKTGMARALKARSQTSAAGAQAVSVVALLIAVSLAYAAGTLASLGAPATGMFGVVWNQPAGPIVVIAGLIAAGAWAADQYFGKRSS
jgi:hypothetical protein